MNTLDKLFLKKWLKPTFGTLLTFLVLFLLVDLFGLVEDLMENWPGYLSFAHYILLRTSYASFFLSPMALLIGSFWMSHTIREQNEWTVSLLSGSHPLILLRAPVIILFLWTVFFIFINIFIMPYTARKIEFYRDFKFEGKSPKKTVTYNNIHLRLNKDRTVTINQFSPNQETIEDIVISQNNKSQIKLQYEAKKGNYQSGRGWVLESIVRRKIDLSGKVNSSKIKSKIIPLPPPDILQRILEVDPSRNQRNPVEYDYKNLQSAINFKTQRGMNATPEKIFFHWKYGFPLTNLVFGLIGFLIGLETQLARTGGIGLCLLIGFGYWITFSMSISLGKLSKITGIGAYLLPLIYVYGPAIGILVLSYLWKKYANQTG